jgi:hypothetical protein
MALAGGECSASRSARFTPPPPSVSLDDVEKRKFYTLPGLEFQPLGRTAGSHSLYRLRYSGSLPFYTKIDVSYR